MLKANITFSEIAKKYKTSIQTISKINRGKIYSKQDIDYPISIQGCYSHLTIEEIRDIIYYLINTDMTYTEIANCLNITNSSVKNINKGAYHNDILQKLGYDKFPIRNNYKP